MEIMCYNTNKLFSGDIPMKMQDYICKVIDSFPRKMLQWDTDIRDPVARIPHTTHWGRDSRASNLTGFKYPSAAT
jgi:hypothetical protein